MAFDPKDLLNRSAASPAPNEVPLGGTKSERLQRLQVGGFGLLIMAMLVALADIVGSRLQETQESVVPEAAAPTVMPSETPAPRDPLVEAGVAPELPATATPTASSTLPPPTQDVPERGPDAPLQ